MRGEVITAKLFGFVGARVMGTSARTWVFGFVLVILPVAGAIGKK
jgi:hypothetical protein